jgi:hypothetical protein
VPSARTIGCVWGLVEPLIPRVPRRHRFPGRKRLDDRKVLTGILFVLQTGIPWEIPAAGDGLRLGDDGSGRRWGSGSDCMTCCSRSNGAPLGSVSIGPVTAADRGDLTELLPRSTRVREPPATRTISVTMHATGQDSAYNTAYADNLSLTLRTFLNISGVGVVHKLG